MTSHSKIKGFSLIELIVVMSVVSVLLALTGGVVQKNISQQERLVEIERVKQYFKQLTYRSYYTGTDFLLEMSGKQINIYINQQEEPAESLEFKQITFVAQDFEIHHRGSITPTNFSILLGSDTLSYQVGTLFDEVQ